MKLLKSKKGFAFTTGAFIALLTALPWIMGLTLFGVPVFSTWIKGTTAPATPLSPIWIIVGGFVILLIIRGR